MSSSHSLQFGSGQMGEGERQQSQADSMRRKRSVPEHRAIQLQPFHTNCSARTVTSGSRLDGEFEIDMNLNSGLKRTAKGVCHRLRQFFFCGRGNAQSNEMLITSLLPLREDSPAGADDRYRLYFVDQRQDSVNWIGFEIGNQTSNTPLVRLDNFGSLSIKNYRGTEFSPVAVTALHSPQPRDRDSFNYMAHGGLSSWSIAEHKESGIIVHRWHVLAVLLFTKAECEGDAVVAGRRTPIPVEKKRVAPRVRVEIIKGRLNDRNYVTHDSIALPDDRVAPPGVYSRLGGRLVQLQPIPLRAISTPLVSQHSNPQLAENGLLAGVPGSELLVAPFGQNVVYILGLSEASRCTYELVRYVLLPDLLLDMDYDIVRVYLG